MHELGVVFHMRDILMDVVEEQNLSHVTKVVVNLGEVSGVVTDLFVDAWEWVSNKTDELHGCSLEINTVEAVTMCNACGETYETVQYGRTCPHCGSLDTQLVCGNELEIREIEVVG